MGSAAIGPNGVHDYQKDQDRDNGHEHILYRCRHGFEKIKALKKFL